MMSALGMLILAGWLFLNGLFIWRLSHATVELIAESHVAVLDPRPFILGLASLFLIGGYCLYAPSCLRVAIIFGCLGAVLISGVIGGTLSAKRSAFR